MKSGDLWRAGRRARHASEDHRSMDPAPDPRALSWVPSPSAGALGGLSQLLAQRLGVVVTVVRRAGEEERRGRMRAVAQATIDVGLHGKRGFGAALRQLRQIQT